MKYKFLRIKNYTNKKYYFIGLIQQKIEEIFSKVNGDTKYWIN